MFNKARLASCAAQLRREIGLHLADSIDVKFLDDDAILQSLIRKALAGLIDKPINKEGYIRWALDSRIQEIASLSKIFVDFICLLRGDEVLGYE